MSDYADYQRVQTYHWYKVCLTSEVISWAERRPQKVNELILQLKITLLNGFISTVRYAASRQVPDTTVYPAPGNDTGHER